MASSTKPHQRAFALVMALIFLVTTLATSAFVIYTIVSENKQKNQASDIKAALDNTAKTTQPKEGTLQGTKLSNFEGIATADKLTSTDLVVGTGEEVKAGATVTAHYTGAYASDGTIFQSSHDGANQPIEFPLSGVIAGWTQGVPGMKVGGTRRLVIPGDLAYGVAPAGYTQGSTERPMGPLVFDIEITAVKN